jgi:hypothetical protein
MRSALQTPPHIDFKGMTVCNVEATSLGAKT